VRFSALARIVAVFVVGSLWLVSLVAARGVPPPATFRVALAMSAVVGTILNFVNWRGRPEAAAERRAWRLRLGMNYFVPFAVSLTSALLT
jgi:drug/metabolite transporter (DMT)-like permease